MQIKNNSSKYTNIIFIGKFASGKSYFSKKLETTLKSQYNLTIYRIHISAKIKDIAIDLFEMKGKDRRLLQRIGEKMRSINKDVWINYTVRYIRDNSKEPFIIEDLRLPREYEIIKKNFPNTIAIKIEADNKIRLRVYKDIYGKMPTKEELRDSTERLINDIKYDYLIKNNYDDKSSDLIINDIIKKFILKNKKII